MSSVVDNIDRTLGRILATQEYIIKQIEQYNNKLDKHIEDDEEVDRRVSKLEHSKSYLLGIVASMSLVIPYASDLLLTKMGLK